MSDTGGPRRAGVRDVAARAGVSAQTVSRVLNDFPGIRDSTRQRVLDAVAALDYRVNNAARALGTSRTRTVGVVASDASLHGPSAGIAALERAARARGRWITTAYTASDDPAAVHAAVQHLLDQGVDGIVLVAAHTQTPLTGYDVPLAEATSHEIEVIAEGVETQAQCDRLVQLGCRFGQGYLFAVPQPASSLAVVLDAPLVGSW